MMIANTLPEPEHVTALRNQMRRFVAEKAPRDKRRGWDKAHDWPRDLFRELCDLGVCGLTIAEEYGGLGQDIVAAVAVRVAVAEFLKVQRMMSGLEPSLTVCHCMMLSPKSRVSGTA